VLCCLPTEQKSRKQNNSQNYVSQCLKLKSRADQAGSCWCSGGGIGTATIHYECTHVGLIAPQKYMLQKFFFKIKFNYFSNKQQQHTTNSTSLNEMTNGTNESSVAHNPGSAQNFGPEGEAE